MGTLQCRGSIGEAHNGDVKDIEGTGTAAIHHKVWGSVSELEWPRTSRTWLSYFDSIDLRRVSKRKLWHITISYLYCRGLSHVRPRMSARQQLKKTAWSLTARGQSVVIAQSVTNYVCVTIKSLMIGLLYNEAQQDAKVAQTTLTTRIHILSLLC